MLDLIEIRKDLHRIPELGFQEFKTTEYLVNILKRFKNLKIHQLDFPGILVEYSYGKGPYKLFRADMDALPIAEETYCDFTSQHQGNMHACGHDVHMTILLGLIEYIASNNLEVNLLFLFQPAEEGKGGAEKILETEILEGFSIASAYALHVSGAMPTGTISSKSGIFFANTQEVEIKIIGKSAHVAFPQKGRNALTAGAEFYLELQKIISSEFLPTDPAICAFGKMTAGTVMNAVPAECVMEGTMRAFSMVNMHKIKQHIEELSKQISQKYDVQFQHIFKCFYKQVSNDVELYKNLKKIAIKNQVKFIEADAVFTGEDFGYFAEKYSGLLFWLGAAQKEKHDLHSPQFLPDEKAIETGLHILIGLI